MKPEPQVQALLCIANEEHLLGTGSLTEIRYIREHPRDQIVPFYESIVPHGYLGWGKSTQLGTGLGLALGARLARSDWLSVNIMGDAAFGMVGMDLETAVRCRIPILTIVFNNGLMGGYTEYMPDAVARYEAHKLGGDYRAVAAGLGAYIAKATEAGDFPRVVLGIAVMCVLVTLFNRLLWRPLYAFGERRLRLG